jgi:hypothetical protein
MPKKMLQTKKMPIFAAVAAINIHIVSSDTANLSDLTLANVEALSQDNENSKKIGNRITSTCTCYDKDHKYCGVTKYYNF